MLRTVTNSTLFTTSNLTKPAYELAVPIGFEYLEMTFEVTEMTFEVTEMAFEVLEMAFKSSEIVFEAAEMLFERAEMIKQYCGIISLIDSLNISGIS